MNEPRQTQVQFVPMQTQTIALDDEAIVDVRSAANFLGYLLRSTRRRRRLMLTTIVTTMVLVTLAAMAMPRSYRIETRILTHKSAVMSALVHPGSSIPPSADNPTGGSVELIKSRKNLLALMNDIHLPELWLSKRSAAAKFKDGLFERAFGKAKGDDMQEAYLKMLDDKISAEVEGDVVLINVEWPDAQVAMTLAEGVQARFLNMRHEMELSEIQETVKILSRNVEMSKTGIGEVVKRMQKIFEQREADLEGRSGSSSRSEPRHRSRKSRFLAIRKPTGPDLGGDDAEVRKSLGMKQAALSGAKRGYDDRLRRAQDELNNLRASLGPDHPDVVEAIRNLEAIAKEPPNLGALEAEQATLAAQIGSTPPVARDKPAPESSAGSDYDLMRVPVSEDLYKEMDKDPEIAAVLDDLKKRQDAHDALVGRLVNANLQSETANVAFEFRYVTTEPPVFPRKPIKPNVPLMLGGGVVASVILGVLLALLADILSGKILETWQVSRFLQMKGLGELEEP